MKDIEAKNFYINRIFKIIFFSSGLWFILLSKGLAGDCWTSDLSEADQLAMARKTFADGVFSASSETAKCYLDEFKNGVAREEMYFLRAEALRKGGDLQGSIKAYDELKKQFPQSKSYLDNAMLKQGISLSMNKNYTLAINTLNSLLSDYPKTKFRDEAHYWLGYTFYFSANNLRNKNKEKAIRKYKDSIRYFNKGNPKNLTQKQQQSRWYLIGHAWWYLNNISKAAKAWGNYLNDINFTKPDEALKIKYQLASRFQEDKKFSKSENWFGRIVDEHPDTKLAVESSFWRAEMAFAASLQKNKKISLKSGNRIVKYYKDYLGKNNNKHKAISYYRIGTIQQYLKPKKAIKAFNNYLSTKEKTFANEILYRLGYLYIETKQPKKAIKVFKQYLKTKDKSFSNEIKFRLGYLYVETKQPKKAIEIFKKYLDSDDKNYVADTQVRLGDLYTETNQLKNAIEIFKKYLDSGDKNYLADTQVRLGDLYTETNQPKKAIEIFKKYLDSGDKNFVDNTQIKLGYLYIENEKINDAIKIFEKYLSGENENHSLEIKLRLAYLYIETKQNFLAISLLEKILIHPDYQQKNEILQTLMVLYRENVSKEKYIQFLKEVRSNTSIDESIRIEFQTQIILTYFEQKKCEKLIEEIVDRPGYIEKIKKIKPEEWQHLMFLKGNCLIDNKKWKKARLVFRQTRESEKYRQQSLEMLLEAHRQLEDWKAITWEFQEIFDSGSPPMSIQYFQLWMFAAQKRKDFQRLDRIKIISERWKKLFPDDTQNLTNINQYLSTTQIQELSKRGKWEEISSYIKEEVKSGKIPLNEYFFSQLLFAEEKTENWEGILSAYTLLSIYDSSRVTKIDALVNQAKAAEKLGKKDLSIQKYNQALIIEPEDENEKNIQEDIRLFLSERELQKLIEDEEWYKVSKLITQEVKSKQRSLDEKNFELLIYSENNKRGENKFKGILEAYKLLRGYNKNKAETIEAFVEQGKAAEKLGKKKIALKYFRKASDKIQREVKSKQMILDEKNFKLLLYIENKKPPREKYNGILDAYALLSIFDKKKTRTIEALVDQGYAAEKLGGYKRAKGYYKNALKKVPEKNYVLAIQLVGELTRLYERSKDYESLVEIYKRAYNILKKNSRGKSEYQAYAYLIGYHYSTNLNKNKNARTWMMRADGGGSSIQELQAGYWVAQIDNDAKKTGQALKRLKELAGRNIPKNSPIYLQIHFELATMYHLKENWKNALKHFRFVAKAKAPKQYKQIQADAKQNVKDIDNYLKSIEVSQ